MNDDVFDREKLADRIIALTGQSGPPIKIATFGTLSPLFPITSLIDLINCELIPTN
jgi:hypothetical protein